MRAFLKLLAWLSKIAAAIICLGVAWFVANMDIFALSTPSHWRESSDWGTPAYKHWMYFEIAQWLILALLAILPNRWLVFSRIVFAVSLLIALIPMGGLFYDIISNIISSDIEDWSDCLFLLIPMAAFAPLPLSLILSFVRLRKGEKIFYA